MCNSRRVCGDKTHLWLNYLCWGLKCSLESMKQPFTAGEAVVSRLLSESYSYLRGEKQRSSATGVSWLLLLQHLPGWEMWWSLCLLWLSSSSPFLGADGVQWNSSKEGHWECSRDLAKVTMGSSGISPRGTSPATLAVFCSSGQADYRIEVQACRHPYRE